MSPRNELCLQLLTLFAGRNDVFAVGKPHRTKPGKLEWFPRREPLTVEHLSAHLAGEAFLGVYPLVDGHVHWFAVDIDGDKTLDDEAAWAKSFAFAQTQVNAFAQKGLITYIERSRSGRGAHIWGFLSRPMPASEVRRAINPMIHPEVNKDLVYPVQDVPDDLGNLLALPWYGDAAKHGYTVFVNRDGEPVRLRDWLQGVRVNDADLFSTLVPELTPQSAGSMAVSGIQRPSHKLVRGFLKLVSPYGCTFMRHCAQNAATIQEPMWRAALSQCSALVNGRDAAHVLSAPYPNYDEGETDYKFDKVSQKPVYTCQYIKERWPDLACKACPGYRPVDKAQATLVELTQSQAEPMDTPRWGRAMERIIARDNGTAETGLLWGIPGWDVNGRLRPSEMTVIGAPPNMGKTALMVDASLRLAKAGTPVFDFSGETAETAFLDRFVANEVGIDSRRLRGELLPRLSQSELLRIEGAIAYLKTLPLFAHYSAGRPDDIYFQIEHVFLTKRLRLLKQFVTMYDYLQLSTAGIRIGGSTSPYEATSMMSAEFKALFKILERPGVVFSQLKREAEGQTAEDASLNQFKESGRIEADLDEGYIMGGDRAEGVVVSRWLRNVKSREANSNYTVPLTFYKSVSRFAGPDDGPVPDGIDLEDLPVTGPGADRAF